MNDIEKNAMNIMLSDLDNLQKLYDWHVKENQRLREALQKIADWPDYRLPSHQEIARDALKGKE